MTDVPLKLHPDEVDADIPLVHQLLSSQFPKWANLSIEPVFPLGTDNVIYRLGDNQSIRLPRLAGKVENLEKELKWLPKLAPDLPLSIPVPVAKGEPGSGYPYIWGIYQWLEGEPATKKNLADLNQAASDLAEFIGALEKKDTGGGPVPKGDLERGVPLTRRDIATRSAITKLQDNIDVVAVTKIWEKALSALEWNQPPVWIHGDLDARNLLTNNGQLSGVIDFGSMGIGDPAYDVMVAWKLFNGDSRELFKKKLNVDEATWTRARGLVLSQAVMALSYYTLKTNEVLVKEAQNWMNEVLNETAK